MGLLKKNCSLCVCKIKYYNSRINSMKGKIECKKEKVQMITI